LKNVSGYALPGETLYVMGMSGSGKTSLLNVLSDRINVSSSHRVSGRILLNNKIPVTAAVYGKIGGYVMQDDVLFAYFSPREAL
jgi:ABC-type multidrug transport system ATPase subunit